jgi:hypothetical protein
MSKRFILVAEAEDAQNTFKLVEYFTSKNFMWAHYIKNSWVLIHNDEKTNSTQIREDLLQILDGKDYLVVEVSEGKWAGRGKIGGKFLSWMKENFFSPLEKQIRRSRGGD